MTYNLTSIYAEVDKRLSVSPDLSLFGLADELCCSYATIQKAIFKHTAHSFRELKNSKRLQMARYLMRQGSAAKEIASQLGYSWPQNFSRFLRNSTGLSFEELSERKWE
jgi:AraC-like DNA-binding protein